MNIYAALLYLISLLHTPVYSWILGYLSNLPFFSGQEQVNLVGPVSCLNSAKFTTLEQAIECLDQYTVPHDYYNLTTYNIAQPNAEERAAWTTVALSLLASIDNCSSVYVPAVLSKLYSVSLYTESSGSSFCVLSEIQAKNGYYFKGWGLMVVPASLASALRNLHISAPHPAYDLSTPQQAAALFRAVGAKSLLIPGRSRTAFLNPTQCVQSSSGTHYYETDPAHNNLEPFYDATRAIFTWQNANGGCRATSCAFIQFHGKGPQTCFSDQIFLSSSLSNSPSSISWYTDDIPRPAKRLKANLQMAFPSWNISLPSDSSCTLTATKNVVGRLLNGVDDSRVCQQSSTASTATGMFIHVEQAAVARSEKFYEYWSEALKNTFEKV